MTDSVARILACPGCGAGLEPGAGDCTCPACGAVYASAAGALDLRPQSAKRVQVPYAIGGHLPSTDGVVVAALAGEPEPELAHAARDSHMDPALVAHFPRGSGGLALDLGCGTGLHRPAVEAAGYEWVGLDYDEPGALLFGDAHALPFRDGSFDFVLSIATLEHLRNPLLAMQEAHRVARPGAMLIGTVAFMETFHQSSFFHHSHLATLAVLQDAGWRVTHLAPSPGWNSLTAQARMGLFPRMPPRLSAAIVKPVEWLHRLWWRVGRLKAKNLTELERQLTVSGAFSFVAVKDGAGAEAPA